VKKTPQVYCKLYYKEYETVKFLQALKYKIRVFFKNKHGVQTQNYNNILFAAQTAFSFVTKLSIHWEIQFDACCEMFSCPVCTLCIASWLLQYIAVRVSSGWKGTRLFNDCVSNVAFIYRRVMWEANRDWLIWGGGAERKPLRPVSRNRPQVGLGRLKQPSTTHSYVKPSPDWDSNSELLDHNSEALTP